MICLMGRTAAHFLYFLSPSEPFFAQRFIQHFPVEHMFFLSYNMYGDTIEQAHLTLRYEQLLRFH